MRRLFETFIRYFIAFSFMYWGGAEAFAQNVNDYITVSSPEDWVKIQSIPSESFELSADQKLSYKLISRQTHISKADRRSYSRFVVDLQTASAVEEEGTITLTFDPSYKKIKIHHIRVINSDGTRDVLQLEDGELFRTETDRDKLLFDGALQFSLAVKGLRVGDRLDYAYTSYGKNPAYGEGYFVRRWQAYSTPAQHIYRRAVIAPDMPIFMKLHAEAVSPKKTKDKDSGHTVFTTSLRDIEGLSANDKRPSWHYGFPAVELSSYDNWSKVGNHFAPYYRIKELIDPSIKAVADEIMQATSEPKEQTRRALNYVQENIRYLGLEMGVGGFEPRQPSLVFERRFGDCKDVTLLLLTLLKSLDVKADPVLVHTDERAGFLHGQPNHWAFNHVVVRAELDGKGYVLDATRGKQLGALDKLDQGNFQKGLRLRVNASEVIDLAQTPYEWRKDFYDEYDLVSDENDILYSVVARYYGENADNNYAWYQDDGLADVEKRFFEYYADFYPSIKIEKPTEVEVDDLEASFTVKAYYRIVDGWEHDEAKNKKTMWALPYELRAGFPVFSGVARTAPYSIPYPSKNRQVLAFKIDSNYSFDEEDLPYKTQAFDYREVNTVEDNLYREIYTYEAKQAYIEAKDAAEVLAFVNKTRDDFGLTIQNSINSNVSNSSVSEFTWNKTFTFENIFNLIAMIVGLGIALFFIIFGKSKPLKR